MKVLFITYLVSELIVRSITRKIENLLFVTWSIGGDSNLAQLIIAIEEACISIPKRDCQTPTEADRSRIVFEIANVCVIHSPKVKRPCAYDHANFIAAPVILSLDTLQTNRIQINSRFPARHKNSPFIVQAGLT